ncbi:MAG: hypothetical protein R3C59_06905 [Planctomycetaceae bacterium]
MHQPDFKLFAFIALAILTSKGQADQNSPPEKRSFGRTITAPRYDADAEKLDLFAGLDNGSFQARVIAKGPEHGFVLITNTTDQIMTVALPDSFVAVPVLKQFGPATLGQPNGNGNGNGTTNGNGNQGNQQPVGGGFQQPGNSNANGNGNNGPGGAGPGFFSIPPERTIRLSYVSACLAHGKPDPTPRSTYVLVKTAVYTRDPVLQQLIGMVASSRGNKQATQAAIWHCTDDLSWEQLALKSSHGVFGKAAYFKAEELKQAKQLVTTAEQQSRIESEEVTTKNSVAVIRSR